MFKLAPTPDAGWEDVAPGIRIQFRHAPAEALTSGRRHVRRVVEADPTADPEFHFVCGIAAWGAVAWEGIGAVDGSGLAEVNADTVTALLRQRIDIYDAIDRLYVEPVLKVDAEGNGSGPSPSGISAEAHPSATPATASAPNAPTGSTNPDPTPAIASGR